MNENFFKSQGWLRMMVPQEGIRSLELLVKNGAGEVRRINARLDSLLKPGEGTQMPIAGEDKHLTDLTGQMTVDLKSSMQVNWLQGLLSIANVNAEAKAAFNNAVQVDFAYKDAFINEVDEVLLNEYINDAVVNEKAKTFADHLRNDDVYIITGLLKSNSFSVTYNKSKDASASLSASATKDAQASANISGGSGKAETTEWEGNEPLVFAVKAVQLHYDKPGWFSKEKAGYTIAPAKTGIVVRGKEDLPVTRLNTADDIISI